MAPKKNRRKQIETDIIVRAWKDPAFKEQLKKDPHKALKALGLKEIPADWQITVVEEKSRVWVIRIPEKPSDSEQMSQRELQASASGEGVCTSCNLFCPDECD